MELNKRLCYLSPFLQLSAFDYGEMAALQCGTHRRWHLAIWIVALTTLATLSTSSAMASRRRDRIRAEDWKMLSDVAFVDDVFGDDPFDGFDSVAIDGVDADADADSGGGSFDNHRYSDQVILFWKMVIFHYFITYLLLFYIEL